LLLRAKALVAEAHEDFRLTMESPSKATSARVESTIVHGTQAEAHPKSPAAATPGGELTLDISTANAEARHEHPDPSAAVTISPASVGELPALSELQKTNVTGPTVAVGNSTYEAPAASAEVSDPSAAVVAAVKVKSPTSAVVAKAAATSAAVSGVAPGVQLPEILTTLNAAPLAPELPVEMNMDLGGTNVHTMKSEPDDMTSTGAMAVDLASLPCMPGPKGEPLAFGGEAGVNVTTGTQQPVDKGVMTTCSAATEDDDKPPLIRVVSRDEDEKVTGQCVVSQDDEQKVTGEEDGVSRAALATEMRDISQPAAETASLAAPPLVPPSGNPPTTTKTGGRGVGRTGDFGAVVEAGTIVGDATGALAPPPPPPPPTPPSLGPPPPLAAALVETASIEHRISILLKAASDATSVLSGESNILAPLKSILWSCMPGTGNPLPSEPDLAEGGRQEHLARRYKPGYKVAFEVMPSHRWKSTEDAALRRIIGGRAPAMDEKALWHGIAEQLGGERTGRDCSKRWWTVLRLNVVLGPWSQTEDQIVLDSVAAGITNWDTIAELVPGRRSKQCRERFFNNLDPTLKKGVEWTEEEKAILTREHARWGNKWATVAKLLPGRSENMIKNYWNGTKRKRETEAAVEAEAAAARAKRLRGEVAMDEQLGTDFAARAADVKPAAMHAQAAPAQAHVQARQAGADVRILQPPAVIDLRTLGRTKQAVTELVPPSKPREGAVATADAASETALLPPSSPSPRPPPPPPLPPPPLLAKAEGDRSAVL